MTELTLFVPLRSNASSLLAGASVARVRQKLKFASLLYEHVLIEAGTLQVNAGPNGSSSFVMHDRGKPTRFQTSRARRSAQAGGFSISIGAEEAPGVPRATLRPLIESEATIAWSATLEPFDRELPSGCDWIEFVHSRDPDGDSRAMAQRWSRSDQSNPALRDKLPVKFVRDLVIKAANRDLVIAGKAGLTVTQDRLHQHVSAQRLAENSGWQGTGFVVPWLFPAVADFDWDEVRDLRQDPHMKAFRSILRTVETEALNEAEGGDLEAAVHHVYERHLGNALGQLDALGVVVERQARGFIVGSAIGVITAGITGPLGVLAGSLLGTGVAAVSDARQMLARRRQRGWVTVHHRLTAH